MVCHVRRVHNGKLYGQPTPAAPAPQNIPVITIDDDEETKNKGKEEPRSPAQTTPTARTRPTLAGYMHGAARAALPSAQRRAAHAAQKRRFEAERRLLVNAPKVPASRPEVGRNNPQHDAVKAGGAQNRGPTRDVSATSADASIDATSGPERLGDSMEIGDAVGAPDVKSGADKNALGLKTGPVQKQSSRSM
jgi:hypothetical protein